MQKVLDEPPMRAAGPNWAEVDKTVQRVRERETKKAVGVAVTKSVEHGFFTMTNDEYESELAKAREEIGAPMRNKSGDESPHSQTASPWVQDGGAKLWSAPTCRRFRIPSSDLLAQRARPRTNQISGAAGII